MNFKLKKLVACIVAFLVTITSLNMAITNVYAAVDYSALTMTDLGTTSFKGFYNWGGKIYAYDATGYLYKHTGTGMTASDFIKITGNTLYYSFNKSTEQQYFPLYNESTGKVYIRKGSGYCLEFDPVTDTFSDWLTYSGYSLTSTITLIGQYGSNAYYSEWSYSTGFKLIELDMDTKVYTNLGTLSNTSIIEQISAPMSYIGNSMDGRYFYVNVDYASPRISGWANIGVGIIDVQALKVIDTGHRSGVGANSRSATFLTGVKISNSVILTYQNKDKTFVEFDMSDNSTNSDTNMNTINWMQGGDASIINFPILKDSIYFTFGESLRSIPLVSLPEKPTSPAVTADDDKNVIFELTTDLEFSFDDSNYIKYNGIDSPDLSGDKTIYIRVAANGSTPASDPIILTFTANEEEPEEIPTGGDEFEGKGVQIVGEVIQNPISVTIMSGGFTYDASKPLGERLSTTPVQITNNSSNVIVTKYSGLEVSPTSPYQSFEDIDPDTKAILSNAGKTISESKILVSLYPSNTEQWRSVNNAKISAFEIKHSPETINIGIMNPSSSIILDISVEAGPTQSTSKTVIYEANFSFDYAD